MDHEQETVDVINFTTKAHCLQPALPVFLADEWGDELLTGLEEVADVLVGSVFAQLALHLM
jgi:hypothetical protein